MSQGPAQPAPGRRPSLLPQLGRHPRPRDRDHQHHRVEGGVQPPHVGAAPVGRRRHRAGAQLPHPHLRAALRRRRPAPDPDAHRRRLPRRARDGVGHRLAEAARARHLLPAQPDGRVRGSRLHAAGRRLLPRARDDRGARLRLRRRRLRRLPAAVHPAGRRRQGVRRRAVLDDEELLDGRLAGGLPVRQPRRRGRAGEAEDATSTTARSSRSRSPPPSP